MIIPRRVIKAGVGALAALTVVLALSTPTSAAEATPAEAQAEIQSLIAPTSTMVSDSAGHPQIEAQQAWCGDSSWPVDAPAHDGSYYTPGYQMYAIGHNGFQSGAIWETISLHHVCLWWGEHLGGGNESISLAAEWDPEGIMTSFSGLTPQWSPNDQSCSLNRIDDWEVIGSNQKTIIVQWAGRICEAESLFVTGSELVVTGGARYGGNYNYYSQVF